MYCNPFRNYINLMLRENHVGVIAVDRTKYTQLDAARRGRRWNVRRRRPVSDTPARTQCSHNRLHLHNQFFLGCAAAKFVTHYYNYCPIKYVLCSLLENVQELSHVLKDFLLWL